MYVPTNWGEYNELEVNVEYNDLEGTGEYNDEKQEKCNWISKFLSTLSDYIWQHKMLKILNTWVIYESRVPYVGGKKYYFSLISYLKYGLLYIRASLHSKRQLNASILRQ